LKELTLLSCYKEVEGGLIMAFVIIKKGLFGLAAVTYAAAMTYVAWVWVQFGPQMLGL
jgi:hypothetical protein